MMVEDDALNRPEDADAGDRQRTGNRHALPKPGSIPPPADTEKGERNDEQLAEIDAEIETEKGDQKLVFRERHLAQAARKTKPVDESETENDDQTPDTEARTEHIFQGDKGNRERNGRFDKFARQAEDAVGRQEQGRGMGHGEGRGLEKQFAPRDAQKKEPEDK